MSAEARVHVGCCGFAMARAAYYARFRLVEVQQTFYQPPRPQTLERWRAEAPTDFVFTLKAWQLITHEPASPTYRRLRNPIPARLRDRYGAFRPSEEVYAAWRTSLACARALAAPILVFQSPASFTPGQAHIANLRAFFSRARIEAGELVLAWEPRGWPVELAQSLCDALGLVRVLDPFRDPPPAQGLRYFRLHGGADYGHTYTDAELERLRGWCAGETWCLFNNRTMVADAERFTRLLQGQGN
ncbi:MAG: DUF72 domain-containing protein [Thiobacillaceae bacterium]|nr:DUF72 domain-containing protein [Thiobacillaceae bacterium]